jgi:hypothetical protein
MTYSQPTSQPAGLVKVALAGLDALVDSTTHLRIELVIAQPGVQKALQQQQQHSKVHTKSHLKKRKKNTEKQKNKKQATSGIEIQLPYQWYSILPNGYGIPAVAYHLYFKSFLIEIMLYLYVPFGTYTYTVPWYVPMVPWYQLVPWYSSTYHGTYHGIVFQPWYVVHVYVLEYYTCTIGVMVQVVFEIM